MNDFEVTVDHRKLSGFQTVVREPRGGSWRAARRSASKPRNFKMLCYKDYCSTFVELFFYGHSAVLGTFLRLTISTNV